FEPVAVDPGLVELLDRKLDALLVLDPEIGTRARHRDKSPDLDDLVFRLAISPGSGQGNPCNKTNNENGGRLSHGPLLKAIVSFNPETGMPANLISSRVTARASLPRGPKAADISM